MLVDDLDRPVTRREFNELINELIKRFDKLDEERAKEKERIFIILIYLSSDDKECMCDHHLCGF